MYDNFLGQYSGFIKKSVISLKVSTFYFNPFNAENLK
jgi:hypothetical protein